MGLSGDIAGRLEQYIRGRGIAITGRLGAGNNGSVWSTSRDTAVKVSRVAEPYNREIFAYLRIGDVEQIAGLWVPRVIDWDDELLVIEMEIVEPPCILDFGSAYRRRDAPRFPQEIRRQWLREKRAQFGADWPRAAAAIREMDRRFKLVLLDVHPGNIMLRAVERGRG